MSAALALHLALMAIEAALAATVLLALFRARNVIGLAPLYTTVGVFYYLATLVAGTTFVKVAPGIMMSPGSVALFPAFCVSHRKDIVDEAIAGALTMAERFDELGGLIEQMQRRRLSYPEQASFAERAMQLRYPVLADAGVMPTQLLRVRRPEDDGSDLWRTFNRVQENLLRGGFRKHSASGRVSAARRISSIAEDVRINGALWDLSSSLIAA